MLQNMLLTTALGDAYGLGFEGCSNQHVQNHNDGENYHLRENLNKNWDKHQPGQYSDDTECAIAVIMTLIALKGFDVDNFVKIWKNLFSMNKSRGYSKETKKLLLNNENTIIHSNRNSTSNGCLMGCHFLGLLPTEEAVMKACVAKCYPMHANSKTILATTIIALVAHYLYYKKCYKVETAFQMANSKVFDNDDITKAYYLNYKEIVKVVCDAHITVLAVYNVLTSKEIKTGKDILIKSIALTGDTDSVAAIALGLYSIYGDLSTISDNLLDNLEKYEIKEKNMYEYLWQQLLKSFPNA